MEELYRHEALNVVSAQEQAMAQSAVNAIQPQELNSEVVVQRLREELNLANMVQATASSNATESDRKLAEIYQEAQSAIQSIQTESIQQNTMLRNELESSQMSSAIQGAKLQADIKELSEQRLASEKLSGELKEQQHMLFEQRRMFQEQAEQTRALMSDYKSLKDELKHGRNIM